MDQVSRWQDVEWVSKLMIYHDPAILEDAANKVPFKARPATEKPFIERASIEGQVAGTVLAVLYILAESPWQISKPSLSRAVQITEKMARFKLRDPRHPVGHKRIEECFDSKRTVGHLWAAERLITEREEHEFRGLKDWTRSQGGLHVFLGLSRTIQEFATAWRPVQTDTKVKPRPVLGESPWLVPDEISRFEIPWATESPPRWVLEFNGAYKRR